MTGPRPETDDERPSRSPAERDDDKGAERNSTQTHLNPARDALSGENQYYLKVTKVEFADLRARLIALESVTISLLLTASDRQLELARAMADHISPREGYTPHPLTLDAANHINQLIDRMLRLRDDCSHQ